MSAIVTVIGIVGVLYLLIGICLFAWPYNGWRGVWRAVGDILFFVVVSACWLPILLIHTVENWMEKR